MYDVLKKSMGGVREGFKWVNHVNSITDMVNIAVNLLLGLTFAGSIVGLAYSFIQFILSKGEKDALSKAKTGLTWSVIVLVISFFVIIFKRLLFGAIGVNSDINNENQEF